MTERQPRKKYNSKRHRYKDRDPNAKSNRFKGTVVAKDKVIGARQKLYAECKEAGMTDMQALVKCFEITPSK
jgi:hypothetical protein